MAQPEMFTPEDRSRIRSQLLDRARGDDRISGAAMTGSAAAGREDRWSDIDLAFGLKSGAELDEVLRDWTAYLHDQHGALHHVDVRAGTWVYRVFILPNTLQIDLAFAPADDFRALAPTFQLVFGTAEEPRHFPPPQSNDLIGLGWLYALHARTSIARGKLWQAEYMISGLRDHTLTLSCVRCGVAALHGRGFDQLPAEVTKDLELSLVTRLTEDELLRAFGVTLRAFVLEIERADAELNARLRGPLLSLKDTQLAN